MNDKKIFSELRGELVHNNWKLRESDMYLQRLNIRPGKMLDSGKHTVLDML